MEMLRKGWVPNIFSQPLMMFRRTLTSGSFWFSFLQFFEDTGGEPLINDIIRVLANNLWSINRHSAPLPVLEPKHLLVKFVWKPLGPCGQFLAQISVKDRLQCPPITDFLVPGRLVNQCLYTDICEAAN